MRVLVIGGSGFIGSHVVDELLRSWLKVRVLDRARERFRDTPSGVDLVLGDVADTSLMAEALAGVDAVIHLASTTVPATSNLDPVADVNGNLIPMLRLLPLMRSSGIRRLIYLSSGGTVYGIPSVNPVPETHPLSPLCSYGVVKVAIENYLMMESKLHGLRPVILRVSNPYGPRQGHGGVQGVIGTYLWQLANGEPVEVWGDGSVVRDFIHVSDVARLIVRAAQSGVSGIFNAGSGTGHSIREVLDAIASVLGTDLSPIFKPGRQFDVPRVVLDTSKAKRAFDWSPIISLEDGLRETWAWVRGQLRGEKGGV